MRVLVACEFSGVVRDAFIRRGHDAVSCDLLPSWSSFGPHIQGDVLELLYGNNDLEWDLLIAHPPCTYLSVSGALYWAQRQKEQQYAIDFFMQMYWAPVTKVCVE